MLELFAKAAAEICCLFGTGSIIGGIAEQELKKTDSKILRGMGGVAAFFLSGAVASVAMKEADDLIGEAFSKVRMLKERMEDDHAERSDKQPG